MTQEIVPPPMPTADFDKRARHFELLISVLLRAGVAISLLLVVMGTILTFTHHTDYLSSKSELQVLISPASRFPHTLGDTVKGLSKLQGRSFVITGLLVLIATPVLRVAVSMFSFLFQHDAIFAAITALVFGLLLLSFTLGKAG